MEARIKPNMSNAQHDDKNNPRINEQITNPQVRLILSTGENIGIISTKEALKKALIAYEGAIILVSHEHDFAGEICNIIFDAKTR